jgi:hypothetical protein
MTTKEMKEIYLSCKKYRSDKKINVMYLFCRQYYYITLKLYQLPKEQCEWSFYTIGKALKLLIWFNALEIAYKTLKGIKWL